MEAPASAGARSLAQSGRAANHDSADSGGDSPWQRGTRRRSIRERQGWPGLSQRPHTSRRSHHPHRPISQWFV